jgi:cell division transport system permease protein
MRRKLITFRRLVIAGIQNFIRNAWLSVAATAVMVVALTIILGAILLNVTARNAIKELSKDIKVSIYLQDGVTEAQRNKLASALREDKAVVDVEYISRDKAQARLKQNQDQGFVDQSLALLGLEALPESYDVSVNDLSKLEEVGNIARREEFKEIVGQNADDITLGKTRSKETIDRAAAAQRYITLSSIMAAALFSGVSVLIIFNTIRMAIYTRSEEIKIMKLIGATPDYIRGPFIIEACMYGVIAGLAANAVIYGFIFSFGSKLSTQREFSETYSMFTAPSMMGAMLVGAVLAGILIAILSSTLAMEKYLRLRKW